MCVNFPLVQDIPFVFNASSTKLSSFTILAFVVMQLTFHVQFASIFVFCLPTKFNTPSSIRSLVRTGQILISGGSPYFCTPVVIKGEKRNKIKVNIL